MGLMVLLASSTIVGIIVTIALVSITIAVCFYLLSLKDKENKK